MNLYRFIQPGDDITFYAEDDDVAFAATFWSTTNDRIAAEDACLRGALKICIKRMCEYCRADAAHSMPGKECVEGCETLRLVKKALGEENEE